MPSRRKRRATYPEAKATRLRIEEAAAAFGVDCRVVNVRAAKDQLSSLLEAAERGERIVITSDGLPKAMIVRYRPFTAGSRWTSRQALRNKMPVSDDSTPLIRRMRDSGY
jgi:prevent-host-death family protein